MESSILDRIPLPKYKLLSTNKIHIVEGVMSLDRGCLVFKTHRGGIIKVIAPGEWREITLIIEESE